MIAVNQSKEDLMRDHNIETSGKHPIITVIWVVLTLAVIIALFGTFLTAT